MDLNRLGFLTKQPDFVPVSFRLVRRFQDDRQPAKRLVRQHGAKRGQPDRSFADARMPVLSAAEAEETVVEMQREKPIQPDDAVERFKNAVKIVFDVVPRAVNVTGVEANADFVLKVDAKEQFGDFLERAAKLRAVSGHRFEQHGRGLVGLQRFVEKIACLPDTRRNPALDMTAGMQVIKLTGKILHPLNVLLHAAKRKIAHSFVGRSGVKRIRRVRDERTESIFAAERHQLVCVRRVDGLCVSAARIAGEKLKRIRADRARDASRGGVTLRAGKMAAEIDWLGFHKTPFFSRPGTRKRIARGALVCYDVRMKHTVLVTGSSRGIGAGVARRFALEGHRVAIHYREREESAKKLFDELAEQGCQVMLVRGDITNEADVKKIVQSVRAQLGAVDILVNNAGIALPAQLITDTSAEDWNRVLSVNVTGMFLVTNAVLPEMISRKRGAIVNISSMWGVTGGSCEVPYSASKAAVIGYTKALAKEVAPSGVRVNCVAPGFVRTEMTSALCETDVSAICEETPLLRAGTPEDIASAVLFLASDEASFITGQVLSVDGGRCI